MAKKTRSDTVAVIAGAKFRQDGRDVRPYEVLHLPPNEAADLVASRLVWYATPDEAAR